MKLTYRGQSYSIAIPSIADVQRADIQAADIQAAVQGQSKIKLIYRGQTYYATPDPMQAAETALPSGPLVTLTYRGVTYERPLHSPKRYSSARAINWRYQAGY
ncbi:MAG: DUF4278 domain-containing protein [Elainella sp.]